MGQAVWACPKMTVLASQMVTGECNTPPRVYMHQMLIHQSSVCHETQLLNSASSPGLPQAPLITDSDRLHSVVQCFEMLEMLFVQ